jgi:hypothetical protein
LRRHAQVRGIGAGRLVAAFERAEQRRRERLAQLDAPLIERIDAQQHAFDKGAMFEQGDQLTQPPRVELRQQQCRRRTVAGTDAAGGKRVGRRR